MGFGVRRHGSRKKLNEHEICTVSAGGAGSSTGRAACSVCTHACVTPLCFFFFFGMCRSVHVRDTCACAGLTKLFPLCVCACKCVSDSETVCARVRVCVCVHARWLRICMRRSVWVCGGGRCRCAAEHMEARTSGSLRCACVRSLGRVGRLAAHISVCERASKCVCARVWMCVCVCVRVCNQHVSSVCMRACVSPALISLCLGAISPELAALKHQRETSASAGLCASVRVCACAQGGMHKLVSLYTHIRVCVYVCAPA